MKAPGRLAVDIESSEGSFAWKNQIKTPGTQGTTAIRVNGKADTWLKTRITQMQ
ncbi:MAG: hypothetical protein AB9842_07860 [Bacteroidales bacterium]